MQNRTTGEGFGLIQTALTQQLLEHFKLLLATVHAQRQLIERTHERRRRIRRSAQRILCTALAYTEREVELAGIQLSQLGKTLTQGIEPGEARLQLGNVNGEGIELTLRILAYGANLFALLIERLGQRDIDHRFGGQPPGTQRGTGTKAQSQQHNNR